MADQPVLMEATQAFSCTLDAYGRVPFAVGAGEVFAADDEVVKRHPGNFRPVRVRDSSTVRRPLPPHPGAVETMTAAPGELRHLTRPPAPPVTAAARKSKTAAAPTATATEPSEV